MFLDDLLPAMQVVSRPMRRYAGSSKGWEEGDACFFLIIAGMIVCLLVA